MESVRDNVAPLLFCVVAAENATVGVLFDSDPFVATSDPFDGVLQVGTNTRRSLTHLRSAHVDPRRTHARV